LKNNAVRSTYAEVELLADTAIYRENIMVKISLVDLILVALLCAFSMP